MEKQTDKKIQFKPLHEGMGFHPFSDGLPYAPESKSKYQGGAGANVAGRPSFIPQSAPKSAPMAPTASTHTNSRPMGTARQLQQQQIQIKSAERISAPQLHITPAQAKPRVATTMNPNANSQVAMSTDLSTSVLRRRAFAYAMDTMIHAGFWLATNLTALFFFKFQIDSEIVKDNFAQFFLFFCISQWMFIALQEMLFENSIGKVFFNLEFKRNHSSLLLRSMVFMAGAACFGLGLFYRPQDKLGQIQLKSKIYQS